jgi:hypothetical protein
MAGLGFMGGMGTVAGGLMQGYAQGQQLQQQQDTADYLKTQRDRSLAEQGREDQLRKDNQGVAQKEDVQVEDPSVPPVQGAEPADGYGPVQQTPVTKTVSKDRNQDAVFRDYASNYLKQGDITKAAEFNEKADKLAFQRTGRQVNEILAGGGDFYSKAKAAAEAFHNDPFGGGIKGDPVQNKDGSITLNLINKDNPGVVTPKTYANEKAFSEALQAHYAPDTYTKIQDARILLQQKIAEERAKGHVVGAGGAFVPGEGDTRKPFINDTGFIPALDSDGNPIIGPDGQPAMVRPGTKGAPKGAAGPKVGEVPKAIELGLKGNEGLIPAATSIASILQQNNPDMPPDTPHALAVEAAKGQNVKTQFDPKTGMFTRHYTDIAETDPKSGQPLRYATNKTYLVDALSLIHI